MHVGTAIFLCVNKYCKKFSVNCNMCRSARCRNSFEFNKSKDILLNFGNDQISWYVLNFLTARKKCCLCLRWFK